MHGRKSKAKVPQAESTVKALQILKKVTEKRRLGLLTIKDKVVQQSIKMLAEPRMENLFVSNSYGYRPNKGALKAIRRALQERLNKSFPWILRLDIDNYFDNTTIRYCNPA